MTDLARASGYPVAARLDRDHGAGPVFGLVAAAMGLRTLDIAVLGRRSTGRSADAL